MTKRSVRSDLKNIHPNYRKEKAFEVASGGCWWIKNWLIANDRQVTIERISRKNHQNF